ncbi:MAG: tryptophan synthase subunit beta [Bacteroidales bacterium]|nr:tryptophan synthase subunit beta [Bacteroidales bacterium]
MPTETYKVDPQGYYGRYGGAYVPEMLYPNLEELRNRYLEIMEDPGYRDELHTLMRDFVGRPSPLYYASRLSQHYSTHIYLKREDLNHTGAHKINNTVGQVLLAERLNKKRIIAETGAGQHGVATATVCALKGLECVVYMGETDMARQARNVAQMQLLGAKVVPVTSGNKTLKDATNEAIRDWIKNPGTTHYIIGSIVGPHPYPDLVTRLQGVISHELCKQLEERTGNANPNNIVACVGGGSNAAGIFYDYLEQQKVRLIAVEASGMGINSGMTAATMQRGKAGILHGSHTLVMQDDDGQVTEPYSISAGLDYPGIGPVHAHLRDIGRVEFLSASDQQALEAARLCMRLEGIIPALESAHALAALGELSMSPHDVTVMNLSGRGDKDLDTYQKRLKP